MYCNYFINLYGMYAAYVCVYLFIYIYVCVILIVVDFLGGGRKAISREGEVIPACLFEMYNGTVWAKSSLASLEHL